MFGHSQGWSGATGSESCLGLAMDLHTCSICPFFIEDLQIAYRKGPGEVSALITGVVFLSMSELCSFASLLSHYGACYPACHWNHS